ncbi:MAG: pyrroline-5-carboxylate reductase [Myxococcales bacterium]|nr:pyrroline-5-carboxylate reductase [Myxococcales bacterium]
MTDGRLSGLRIGIVGAGNMGTTILEGLLDAAAASPSQLMASDPRASRRDELASRGIGVSASNLEVARFAELLVLATKPQVMDRVLKEIAPATGPGTLVVSIAAGVSIAAIESMLLEGTRVVRTMPNTPALVGAGATAIAPGTHVSESDLGLVEALFSAVGITEILEEGLLDAVTGLSGSGPAFIFVIIDALADGGVKVGLHRATAQRLAAQTVLGAAKMLIETGEHPGQLKDMVASPGGTTIAGLHTLESGGLRKTLMDAVENAALRSRALGEELAKKKE